MAPFSSGGGPIISSTFLIVTLLPGPFVMTSAYTPLSTKTFEEFQELWNHWDIATSEYSDTSLVRMSGLMVMVFGQDLGIEVALVNGILTRMMFELIHDIGVVVVSHEVWGRTEFTIVISFGRIVFKVQTCFVQVLLL